MPDKCKKCESCQTDMVCPICKLTGMLIEDKVPEECPKGETDEQV